MARMSEIPGTAGESSDFPAAPCGRPFSSLLDSPGGLAAAGGLLSLRGVAMAHAQARMTPRCWRRFAALRRAIRDNDGVAPTHQELAAIWAVVSKNTVSRVLGQLEAAGLIRRLPARHRAIEVVAHACAVRDGDGEVRLLPPEVVT